MHTTEECGLDVSLAQNRDQGPCLLMRIRNFRLSFKAGQLVNSLVTIGMTKTTLQWTCSFIYLFNLLRKNISYTKFVEAGKGQSVYRLGFGPDGFGFESLYRQELFPLFKTPIPALESTYTPMLEVPWLFSGLNRPVRDVDHSTPTSRCRGEERVEMYLSSHICLHVVTRNNVTLSTQTFYPKTAIS